MNVLPTRTTYMSGAHRGQNRVLAPPELHLGMVMNHHRNSVEKRALLTTEIPLHPPFSLSEIRETLFL